MHLIPFQTKLFVPPQDSLVSELEKLAPTLQEKDVVIISSKIVAIAEGRCVSIEGADKQQLVEQEADLIIERPYWTVPLTVTRSAFIGAAGVDESNGDGYFILLPEDAFASAEGIYHQLQQLTGLQEFGVVITDSRSQPLRYGATGVAIGWWGIQPLESHIGKPDLFGRELRYERSNVVDGLAAAACLVMGEVAEQTPIVIARTVPALLFTTEHTATDIMCPFADDTFRVLYERYLD